MIVRNQCVCLCILVTLSLSPNSSLFLPFLFSLLPRISVSFLPAMLYLSTSLFLVNLSVLSFLLPLACDLPSSLMLSSSFVSSQHWGLNCWQDMPCLIYFAFAFVINDCEQNQFVFFPFVGQLQCIYSVH